MKWELDDNTSDGLRFLLVGVGSLLVLRLLYGGVLQLMGPSADDALAVACARFHNGYWITDPHTVVLSTTGGIGDRLAMAVAVSMFTAVVLALLIYLPARKSTWAIRTLRLTLTASLCWWLFAALTRPIAHVRIHAGGMEFANEADLLGQLSLPWPATRSPMDWTEVKDFTVRDIGSGMRVDAVTRSGTITLAEGDANDAAELARQLNAWRAQHTRP